MNFSYEKTNKWGEEFRGSRVLGCTVSAAAGVVGRGTPNVFTKMTRRALQCQHVSHDKVRAGGLSVSLQPRKHK